MKRSAVLALAALALSTAGAAAQTSPYYNAWRDAELELGARYVYGQPSFKAKVKDFDGTPVSRLAFAGIDSHSGEIFGRINHKSLDLFARAQVGFGYNIGGTLRDDDYAIGLGTVSSTSSKLSNSFITDVTVDVGWTPMVLPWLGLRFGPFAGFLYRNDVFTARGVTCNPDDVGGAVCGAPGSQPVASNAKVIQNDVRWTLPRIGLEASMPIADNIGVRVEGSYLIPGLEGFRNEDSHFLRQAEIGPVPNFIDTSTKASGFTVQGSIDYRIGERTSIGIGARRIVLDSGVAKAVAGAGLPADQQSVARSGGVFQTTQGFLQLKVSY